MHKKNKGCFVPVLTCESGTCLTSDNWAEVGIDTVSYHLQALLMKPGFASLSELVDLAYYVGWKKNIVLNASSLHPNKEGDYIIRSQYDGSRAQYTTEQLLTVIAHLKPTMVLLPKTIHQDEQPAWQSLPLSIMPFFSVDELPDEPMSRPYGIYFIYDENRSFADFLAQLSQYKQHLCYVIGHFSPSSINALVQAGVNFIESEQPALEAFNGIIYEQTVPFSLLDDTQRVQFHVIDASCQCPTCQQGFTRAYLHHLFQHTPLLCQRLLIQHNVYSAVTNTR